MGRLTQCGGGVKLHRTRLAAAAAVFSIFSRETGNGKQYFLLIFILSISLWETENRKQYLLLISLLSQKTEIVDLLR